MIQAFWFDLNAINAGASRPDGLREAAADQGRRARRRDDGRRHRLRHRPRRHEVVLKDVSIEAAERGKALLAEDPGQGRQPRQDDAGEGRRGPRPHHADRRLRRPRRLRLRRRGRLREGRRSSTRSSPRSRRSSTPTRCSARTPRRCRSPSLAEGVRAQEGLHRPALLLPGRQDAAAGDHPRRADLATRRWPARSTTRRQIKKTPIVVNDSRGFFTSRVIGTFVNEALAMLGEGVAPATVEQATTQAGYPVGALQLADELNLELFLKIRNETRDAMGDAYVRHPAEDVVEKMVELGRPGRLRRQGLLRLRRVGQAHRASGRGSPSTSRCRATRPTSTCTSSRSGCWSSRPSSRRAASRRACC